MGKTKLFVGLILLIVGAGLIPTGIVLDNKLNEGLDAAIPGALLEIRDGFLPAATEMIKFEAIPEALVGLKDELEPQIPYLLNGSITAQTINGTITSLAVSVGITTAKDMFFNDLVWSTSTSGAFPINSISEVMGQSLGFTAASQDYILYGNGPYPGLITDLTQGDGIFGFLQRYLQSVTPSQQSAMSLFYNATWEQLGNVSAYLSNYMFPLVPTLGGLPFPADSTYAPIYFHMQWANASLVPTGIPLPIGAGIVAWEIGVDFVSDVAINNPSDFLLTLSTALWDVTNITSPFNTTTDSNDGYHDWYGATLNSTRKAELMTIYEMSTAQFDLFTDYLFDEAFRDRVVVPLVEEAYEQTFADIVLDAFYLQWSVGALIPTGISSLGPEYENLAGFEIILPADNPEGAFSISLADCRNMWDPENTVALVDGVGIRDWLSLARIEDDYRSSRSQNVVGSIEYPIISGEFLSLNLGKIITMADWLLNFRNNILPNLALESGEFFMHPTELANMVSTVGITAGGLLGFLGIILIFVYRRR
jgi:hypothetical protein